MDDSELSRRLEQSFGPDASEWPNSLSQTMVEWHAHNMPRYSPETKTMPELQQELQEARQILEEQKNPDLCTMFVGNCEMDVFQLQVRIERMKKQDTF